MQTLKFFGAVLTLSTLALAGCQGEDVDRETTDQDLSAAAPAAVADAPKAEFRHGPHDPAKMFARLDSDGDGRVLVSELPERAREHLVKADLDNDGVITLPELTSAHQQMETKMKAEMFAKADKNADGKIAQSEVEARHWDFIKVADADGDGFLTKAELEAAHASGKLRPPPGEHGKHKPTLEGMLEHFDANKDGKLALTELPEPMRERIQTSDKNADGILDSAELTTHFAEMKARFDKEN